MGSFDPRDALALVCFCRQSYKSPVEPQVFRTMHERSLAQRTIPSRRPCLTAVLRMAGLRPTRQRVALAELLFSGAHRHVSAEQLHAEALTQRVNVSLATIYNSLHQFREAGLRALLIDSSPQPQPASRQLAQEMGARYLPLPYAGSTALSQAVSLAAKAASAPPSALR